MEGFDVSLYQPSVIVLENYYYDEKYTDYMKSVGYRLDLKLQYNWVYVPNKKF